MKDATFISSFIFVTPKKPANRWQSKNLDVTVSLKLVNVENVGWFRINIAQGESEDFMRRFKNLFSNL